jgi:anti-sigma regulatory factor (Ser/Thr protein kinase)
MALAGRLGFNEVERSKVGIVVTELANNLVRYAKDGVLLLHEMSREAIAGIEILSLDKGPGIDNISECLQDGFSTGSTPGNGMGAIQRLSSFFDIYSMPNIGTAIAAHVWADPVDIQAVKPSGKLDLGVVCLPKDGEEISGDTWASSSRDQACLILVADGLGHGPQAAQAAIEAVRVFDEQHHQSPKEIVMVAHQALRSTRGAALAIAQINFDTQTLDYAGVGNIAGAILTANSHVNLVSLNGTVGYAVRKVQEFSYAWHSSGLLIMHSDGLGTQWHLDRYPGLSQKHPSLIAGVLYRDYNRGRDDVTVLVARER